MPSLEKARFGRLGQALYSKTVLWAETGDIQRPGQTGSPTVEGSGPLKGKRRKVALWNDGRTCASVPCQFQHACSLRRGDHRKMACVLARERPPTPTTSL